MIVDGERRDGGPTKTSRVVELPLKIADLLELPLFDQVAPDIAEPLAKSFEHRSYHAGTMLVESGKHVQKLQVVVSGMVELCRLDAVGHEYGVLLLSALDVILPAAAILEERSLISVRAVTSTQTLELDGPLLRRAMQKSTALTFNLMKVTCGQWRMAVRSILDLTGRSAAERLAAFLLRIADLQHGDAAPELPIPKRSLATRLGIRPETLSRTLQIVAEHGLHLRGRVIIVHDRAKVTQFCGPDFYTVGNEHPLSVYAM
ncbi:MULTISPECIES: helix-turn-helix domain-containing protein [Sphingomonas]|uniref:helix-turn-helix domain-containing protein n=1 Tax=Sphingomonas TaxID=13687 RepID=UPI0013B3EF68|nr:MULTISPECIES: helix-turn-helix domain-containing protein [Sphingomonas]